MILFVGSDYILSIFLVSFEQFFDFLKRFEPVTPKLFCNLWKTQQSVRVWSGEYGNCGMTFSYQRSQEVFARQIKVWWSVVMLQSNLSSLSQFEIVFQGNYNSEA